jgi:hypothetical protein
VPFGDLAALDRWGALGVKAEVVEQTGESDLVALRRYLFAQKQPPEREPVGDVRFFSAPGEGRECVEIARRIVQEARRGVRFDEIAVFLRAPQRYIGLLEHALNRAGVPAWFDRGTRRPHPAGRAFLAILACACEHLSARRFAEYLSLAQVPRLDETRRAPEFVMPQDDELSLPGTSDLEFATSELDLAPFDAAISDTASSDAAVSDPSTPSSSTLRSQTSLFDSSHPTSPLRSQHSPLAPSRPTSDFEGEAIIDGSLRAPWKWETLIVESAVIGGDPQRWHRRLAGLANELRLQRDAERKEDPDSARVARIERDLRNVAHLRAFALPIIDRLAAWPDHRSPRRVAEGRDVGGVARSLRRARAAGAAAARACTARARAAAPHERHRSDPAR